MAGKGFFGDQRAELTILKANFPDNMLCYINQGTVSLAKGDEKALYLDFILLCQIMPVANVNPEINLATYDFKENEVLIYCPVYNKSTGLYGGLTKKLGHITLWEDAKECFFSYGYNKEKSSLFCCSWKRLYQTFSIVWFLKSIYCFYLMKIKIRHSFQICSFSYLQPLIEKKTF